MFRAIFAHLQERETEIFTAYGNLLLWWAGSRWAAACHAAAHAPEDGQRLPETCWADLI